MEQSKIIDTLETYQSLGCTCAERGGAVRSVFRRIDRDLDRCVYDYINRVLKRFRLAIYKGM